MTWQSWRTINPVGGRSYDCHAAAQAMKLLKKVRREQQVENNDTGHKALCPVSQGKLQVALLSMCAVLHSLDLAW